MIAVDPVFADLPQTFRGGGWIQRQESAVLDGAIDDVGDVEEPAIRNGDAVDALFVGIAAGLVHGGMERRMLGIERPGTFGLHDEVFSGMTAQHDIRKSNLVFQVARLPTKDVHKKPCENGYHGLLGLIAATELAVAERLKIRPSRGKSCHEFLIGLKCFVVVSDEAPPGG